MELLWRLSEGWPVVKIIGDRVEEPSSVAEGLVPVGGLAFPAAFFPLPRRGALKVEAEGFMQGVCNLTGQATQKT